jgi:periplasmic copper chaperone A
MTPNFLASFTRPLWTRFLRGATAALLLFPLTALQAHEYYADGFMIIHPWADPTPPGVVDAPVYLSLAEVTKGDRLLRAMSPLAERVEFRAGDAADAPALSELSFGVGDTDAFGVGKPHLVMRGLKVPFEDGRFYVLMLDFERAGKVVLGVSVGAH